jgi:hypothetical protein
MALRLIEMVLREKDGGEVRELLKEHKVLEHRQKELRWRNWRRCRSPEHCVANTMPQWKGDRHDSKYPATHETCAA